MIAAFQGIFVLALVLLLLANRVRGKRERRRAFKSDAKVTEGFTQWLLDRRPLDAVVRRLRSLAPDDALEHAMEAITKRIPPERREELVGALRREPWLAGFLSQARSRFWWRRLDAARALTVAGEPGDRDLLRLLLADRRPVIQLAATGALVHIADARIVAEVLEALADNPPVVRRIQMHALLSTWPLTGAALLARLRPDAPGRQLEGWVALAELSGDPACVSAAAALDVHTNPEVRAAVARVLRHYFHPSRHAKLEALLRDPEWVVRAAAARTAGGLGDAELVEGLRAGSRDPVWWVRFRASLALAQLGEPGRRVLREEREGPDAFARDMATFVSGLSDGGVLELAET